MTDKNTTALTAASALDGTELVPIVQGGNTRKGLISAIRTYLLGLANTWTGQNTFAAGSIASSAPHTWTQTWNNAGVMFTGLLFNATDTASAAASLLMDLQVGGSSKFKVGKNGGPLAADAAGYAFIGSPTTGAYARSAGKLTLIAAAVDNAELSNGALQFKSGLSLEWSSGAIGASSDLTLLRDGAANILAQRNGTNAQAQRVYNTWTNASNGEWGTYNWSDTANVLTIGTKMNGTGVARALQFVTGGTAWLNVATTGIATFVSGPLSTGPTSGLGYATGAGGTVTQATSRTTGVTLSKVTGQITTTADSIAALGIVTFTVTNTAVAATDVIVLSKVSGDIDTSAFVSAVAAGSFNISLRNNDAGSADTTAFVVNFAVIKGVTS